MPVLAKNKDVNFNYEILEEYEAGLQLTGAEVKSAKKGNISMKGSFVSIKNGQAMLRSMHISPYSKASIGINSYNPTRDRKLLLHKQEIEQIVAKTSAKGLTIVPISVYTTRRLVKVKIAIARGKRKFDKRAKLKKRDIDRRIKSKIRNF